MGYVMETAAKHDRILDIYNRLVSGDVVRKQDLADEYGVNPRSIQRDIDSIRNFYAEYAARTGSAGEIKYDRGAKGFRLVGGRSVKLSNAELFSVVKILLENRSLCKEEMKKIVLNLVDACLPDTEKKKMTDLIRNELFHYMEPRHEKKLIDMVWEIGAAVYEHHVINIEYKKSTGETTSATIKPVGIMNSEYYFYLIAYIGDKDKKYPGYPTIYRMDRIVQYKIMEETFHVPYRDRFEEGEFRKRIPFMYGGRLHKVEFVYKGPDINAVLDRLPSSKCKKLENGVYLVQTEVYGNIGIDMWLKSQGEMVEMIEK